MARTLSIPSRLWLPGTYVQAIDTIPASSAGFVLTLTREAWPVGQVGTLAIDISADNGATFAPWISQDLQGGVLLDKLGNPLTVATIRGTWPGVNDGSGNRKALAQTGVRVTLTLTQAIQSALTLQDR